MGESLLKVLVNNARNVESHQPGQIIFREGDTGETMYVVRTGTVELLSKDVLLTVVREGSIFGEMTLIDDTVRSATARVREECELVPIDKKWFDLMIQKNPSIAREIMRIMAERLQAMNKRLSKE